VLIILVASLEFSSPMPVVSNTDSKVVEAVALKDSPWIAPPAKTPEEKPLLKPEIQQAVPTPLPAPQPNTTAAAKPALAPAASQAPSVEQKLAIAAEHKKTLSEKKQKNSLKNDLSKQLLAELEDEIAKQAKAKQKMMKNKFSRELKAQSEKALQQLMKEQKPMAERRSQHMQGVIDKYKAQIIQAIGQQWVVPAHVNKQLSCQLLIHLAPGGGVLDVQVTQSSGDLALDRSARAAVFKASPLPVPDDILSFEPFRQFVLKVKPENIVENNGDSGSWLG
jgi:colicin import membrane protein